MNLYDKWEELKEKYSDKNVTYFKPTNTMQVSNQSLNTLVIRYNEGLNVAEMRYKENKFDRDNGIEIKDAVHMPDDLKTIADELTNNITQDREEPEDEMERG